MKNSKNRSHRREPAARQTNGSSGLSTVLTLESTCDETAAAIVRSSLQADSPIEILSSVVASQSALHDEYRGVVPEIAARAHVERILPVMDQALRQAEIGAEDLDAVAVAYTPGLAGSLLTGLMAAKSLAWSLGIPLVAVNHLYAHIYACQLDSDQPVYPCVGMIVSGGHTHLYRFDSPIRAQLLGGTIDDAAGEAFDKVASMLGLGYPGGPAISKAAAKGDPDAFAFPRSFINEPRLDFSFSGLKTAVRYAITGQGNHDVHAVELTEQQIADLAASFERAVVDCLVRKPIQALEATGLNTLCVGGGVAANRLFRQELADVCANRNVQLHFAPMQWCTDNAAMGAIAIEQLRAGDVAELDLDIAPGLVREKGTGAILFGTDFA